MYLLAFSVYSFLKNKIRPSIAQAAILVKDKIPLAPELNWLIQSLITPKGSNKKNREYLFNPLVKKKAIDTIGIKINSKGKGTTHSPSVNK